MEKENTASLGSIENPVKCKGIEGELNYLNKLTGPGGIAIAFKRLGSQSKGGAMLDAYEVIYKGLVSPILIYFDMYAKGPATRKAVAGLHLYYEFLKPQYWQDHAYLREVIKKLPLAKTQEHIDQFNYLYFKAGALLSRGPHVYAIRDAMSHPLPEWDIAGIMDCAMQLVHQLRGIDASYPILVNNMLTIQEFLITFHFETRPEELIIDNTRYCAEAKHIYDNRSIAIWFSLQKQW